MCRSSIRSKECNAPMEVLFAPRIVVYSHAHHPLISQTENIISIGVVD